MVLIHQGLIFVEVSNFDSKFEDDNEIYIVIIDILILCFYLYCFQMFCHFSYIGFSICEHIIDIQFLFV
jgi:hypothetical protein